MRVSRLIRQLIALLICAFLMGACASSSPAPASTASSSSAASSSQVEEEKEEETEPEEAPAEEDETSDIDAAIEAYVRFLEDEVGSDSIGAFCLIHLDDDEMPELVVMYGDSHPNGPVFHTYVDGEVVKLESYGSFGRGYYEPRKGTIFGFYTGMGSTYTMTNEIQNDATRLVLWLKATDLQYIPPMDEGGFEFSVSPVFDGEETELTEEQYVKILTPYQPDNRQYREIRYELMPILRETEDIEQALRDTFETEDDFPEADIAAYYRQIIIPEEYIPEEYRPEN